MRKFFLQSTRFNIYVAHGAHFRKNTKSTLFSKPTPKHTSIKKCDFQVKLWKGHHISIFLKCTLVFDASEPTSPKVCFVRSL